MKKQTRHAAPAESAKRISGNVLFAGVVCLAVGLIGGYYLGIRSGRSPAPIANQTGGGTATPAAFVQNEAALKAAVQANPNDSGALTQLGNLYYDHGQYRDAVAWYEKALAIIPGNPDVRTDLGTSYWNLGQPDMAISEFQKALESDPSHAQTLYNMGVVYLNGKNNPAEAKKAWERLLATNPNYPDKAKLQQEIAALSSSPVAGSAQSNAGTAGVEELLQRMKTPQK